MWTFYKIDNHLQISNTYIPAPAFSPNGKKRTLFPDGISYRAGEGRFLFVLRRKSNAKSC